MSALPYSQAKMMELIKFLKPNSLKLLQRQYQENLTVRCFRDYSNCKTEIEFIDQEDIIDPIRRIPFDEVLGIQIWVAEKKGSSTQPDTDTYDYTIHPEYIAVLKTVLELKFGK